MLSFHAMGKADRRVASLDKEPDGMEPLLGILWSAKEPLRRN
jgi:hypothetical protein